MPIFFFSLSIKLPENVHAVINSAAFFGAAMNTSFMLLYSKAFIASDTKGFRHHEYKLLAALQPFRIHVFKQAVLIYFNTAAVFYIGAV